MTRGVSWYLLAPLVLAGLLTGCRFDFETRDPWRAEAEEQCLAQKGVVPSAFMEPLPPINGSGACGMEHPFQVHAFADGNVLMEPSGKLACPVIHELDMWIDQTVQPAAIAWLGQPVVAIRQMSSYSCRTMNGQAGAKISEHAFGNALDVGAFKLADGRWITVKNGWKGTQEERGFLLQVQAGACERFTTVLAPGSNVFHYDHIHVDLMRHAKGRTICKPAPRPMPAPLVVKAPTADLPPFTPAVMSPAPYEESAPVAPPPQPYPPQAYPQQEPPAVARQPAPDVAPPGPSQNLPPGWIVGPEAMRPPAPMSYAPTGEGAPLVTGSVPKRKYYTAPVPQASPIPLPAAKPGED